jgi:hypothetical protein
MPTGTTTARRFIDTGKRPLVIDPPGLSADDMVVYLRMAERAERRYRVDQP